MSTGAETTGTRNEYYDLVSVLYRALQGAQTYEQYIRDAELAGDEELARFLRQVQDEDRRRADRAKELLGQRLAPGRSPRPEGIGASEIVP